MRQYRLGREACPAQVCFALNLSGRVWQPANVTLSYIKQLEDKVSSLEKQLALQSTNTACGTNGSDRPANEAAHNLEPSDQSNIYSMMQITAVSDPVDETADSLLGELRIEAALPTGDAAASLITVYFDHSDSFSPIIRRTSFEAKLKEIRKPDPGSSDSCHPNSLFTTYMVFATAILLMSRTTSLPASRADAYFFPAKRIVSQNPNLIHGNNFQSIENIALMVQYLLLSAKLRPAWHLLGVATRLVVELGLHKLEAHDVTTDSGIDKCWLFWSIYSFERMVCAVLERPVSFPDEIISAPLPGNAGENRRQVALQLIHLRQILSEICFTLLQPPPRNGAKLDIEIWRENMLNKLQVFPQPKEAGDSESSKAGSEAARSYIENLIILLLFPSPSGRTEDSSAVAALADAAYSSIQRYRQLLKSGQLRYYWRTMRHLHRAGTAMIYCIQYFASASENNLPVDKFRESVHVCSAVLWGMAERYPPGAKYRDDFDMLASSLDVTTAVATTEELYAASMDLDPFWNPDSLENYAEFIGIEGFE